VICERLFQQVVADGEAKTFRVAWMQPIARENDWACEYVIEWPDSPRRTRRIMGVDSVQALLLAMKSASAELYGAEPQVFWWNPGDVLDLPILDGVADLEAARTMGRG
jgi:hypothetical protein